MSFILLCAIVVVVPLAFYYIRQYKISTPSLQWPALARVLAMNYAPDPPRITGQRNGRALCVEADGTGARVSMALGRPSRLRVEIGPREEVTRRSGMLVPDPVPTGDTAFEERFLARCNDKAAGLKLLDPVLRQRLLAQPFVEILGQGDNVRWLLPWVKEPDPIEETAEILTAIAEEMERFPA
ncbi:MAG: hypothetical protein PHF00_04595 [Elusimicrobia bacterium]|nr:hypothetical protein [Elusimicrobiota bacterium]